jgi:uncharacterized protein (DUF2384 family)
MYISSRGILIRNIAAATVNGAITLVILLIAPLGLAAVILNTVLVTISTFLVCTAMDLMVVWLLQPTQKQSFPRSSSRRRDITQRDRLSEIEEMREEE